MCYIKLLISFKLIIILWNYSWTWVFILFRTHPLSMISLAFIPDVSRGCFNSWTFFILITVSSYERYSVSCNLFKSQKPDSLILPVDEEIGCSDCFGLKLKILDSAPIHNNQSVKVTWIQMELVIVWHNEFDTFLICHQTPSDVLKSVRQGVIFSTFSRKKNINVENTILFLMPCPFQNVGNHGCPHLPISLIAINFKCLFLGKAVS